MTTEHEKEEKRGKDLEAVNLNALKWNSLTSSAKSIEELYEIVHAKALGASDWYLYKRIVYRRWARILRLFAALFAAAGVIAPVLSLMWEQVPVELGYAFFTAVGACLILNRSLGISSGWIRYITTASLLKRAVEDFQLEWVTAKAHMGGKPTNHEQVNELLEMLKQFLQQINQLVEEETNNWAVQFNQDLAQLEKFAQARMQSLAPAPAPVEKTKKKTKKKKKS